MADNLPEKSEMAKREEAILKFWQENKIFEKTLQKPSPNGEFVFYEGPPTANGRPGIHHLEARAFKDAIPRYKTMRGYHVRRKGGWDTHGLPVELQVEKELGLKSKKEVETYGVAAFNQKCKESVWTYVKEWEDFTNRLGYWIDLQNPYITYKSEYIEALWKIVKTVDEKGLLYKDYKVVPWCPRCGTGLSSHELAQGYEDVKDLAVTVKFKVKNEPNSYLLAWTTTPWTLPGNVALAVGSKINYVRIKVAEEIYILAKTRLALLKDLKYEIVSELFGEDLVGLEYEQLYPFMPGNDKSFQVYAAGFVTTEDGTGIVHTAVMYGQDDFELGTKVGLPKYHLVNDDGTFKAETGFLAGKFVKDEAVAVEIIKDLAGRGLLFAKEKYEHSYPHCWRCHTPLIYFARDSWYIKMSALRDQLVEENEGINWEPKHIKEGRFGEWLREVKDWAISRERYWGTPLPVWLCDKCGEKKVVGSIAETEHAARNRYFIMRHGQAESNVRQIVTARAPGEYHLTEKGKSEVEMTAEKLIEEKIDLIIASPVLRTRETAALVAAKLGLASDKIIFDERLREIGFGDLEGESVAKYQAGPAANGESMASVRARAMHMLYEFDAEYAGKKILLVTHEAVVCVLNNVGEFPTGEASRLEFQVLPHNENFELDLHRPYIDEVRFTCSCGGEMKRVKEVMDVWFDSGSMPFAQGGDLYPADFISEAIDQTRGWFYTLHAIGILMGKGKAYKNVICLGHILDAEGKKMSKSLGNVINPWTMMDKYGADALRFWMYSVNQPGDSKNFDEKTVDEIVKKVFNLTTNVVSFYEMYADSSIVAAADSKDVLDRWIIARLNQLTENVTRHLDAYVLLEPTRAIRDFIGDLSQWYLRRSRDRFKSENETERKEALATTRYVLLELAKIMAPFTPFLAEQIFSVVKSDTDPESVHLCDWPKQNNIDSELVLRMAQARIATTHALMARQDENIKVRQPLGELKLNADFKLSDELQKIVREETNIKKITFEKDLEVIRGLKGNPNWLVFDDFGTLQLALNIEITPKLQEEGEVRDLIREIQAWRKEQNLKPGEKVKVPVSKDKKELVEKFAAQIQTATSASGFEFIA